VTEVYAAGEAPIAGADGRRDLPRGRDTAAWWSRYSSSASMSWPESLRGGHDEAIV